MFLFTRIREARDNEELLDYEEDEDNGLDSAGAKVTDEMTNK